MKKFLLAALVTLSAGAVFAQGSYLEFKISGASAGISGNMKLYNQDGNSRSEMEMVIPQMPGGALNVTTLYLANAPDKIYMLDDKAKTYTEMQMPDASDKSSSNADFSVTVIGKETVNGYISTHVKIKMKGASSEQEMWTSTAIANYEKFKNIRSKYTSDKLFKALAAKGADGFPVRMKLAEHGMEMQMDLVKSESKPIPSSLLSLNGYAKSGSSGTGGSTGTSNSLQDMIQKMQNMTPEERDAMVKQLQQQYGNQPH